jgi:hypothetical protein
LNPAVKYVIRTDSKLGAMEKIGIGALEKALETRDEFSDVSAQMNSGESQ